MNPDLQHKFEKQCLEKNIVPPDERSVFNKDRKGVYTFPTVFFMYRIWVAQEVLIEKLERQKEEMFMLGYTDAENDFMLKRLNKC